MLRPRWFMKDWQTFLGKTRAERLRCIQRERRIQREQNYALRRAIEARDGRRCACCGATHILRLDHILPISKGGKTVLRNLQLLCCACDRAKGAEVLSYRYRMAA